MSRHAKRSELHLADLQTRPVLTGLNQNGASRVPKKAKTYTIPWLLLSLEADEITGQKLW